MKRFFVCVASFLISVSSAQSQIVIERNNIPEIGELCFRFFESVGVENCFVGAGGENQDWFVPIFGQTNVHMVMLVDPALTPFSSEFPAANRCQQELISNDEQLYRYEFIADTAYFSLGIGIRNENDSSNVIYNSLALFMPLPLHYQDSWITAYRFSDSGITITDSTVNFVDGWGTVNGMDFEFEPCLRVFSSHWHIESSPPNPDVITQRVSYRWFNQWAAPIASLTSEVGDTNPNFDQGYVTSMYEFIDSVDPVYTAQAQSFSLGQNYPNPFNPSTTLPIALSKPSQLTLKIYNLSGQLMKKDFLNLQAGNHAVKIHSSGWSSGNYFVKVESEGFSQSRKLSLIK